MPAEGVLPVECRLSRSPHGLVSKAGALVRREPAIRSLTLTTRLQAASWGLTSLRPVAFQPSAVAKYLTGEGHPLWDVHEGDILCESPEIQNVSFPEGVPQHGVHHLSDVLMPPNLRLGVRLEL